MGNRCVTPLSSWSGHISVPIQMLLVTVRPAYPSMVVRWHFRNVPGIKSPSWCEIHADEQLSIPIWWESVSNVVILSMGLPIADIASTEVANTRTDCRFVHLHLLVSSCLCRLNSNDCTFRSIQEHAGSIIARPCRISSWILMNQWSGFFWVVVFQHDAHNQCNWAKHQPSIGKIT